MYAIHESMLTLHVHDTQNMFYNFGVLVTDGVLIICARCSLVSIVIQAVAKGAVMPKEARFDSNSITPGTEFMARLHEQLKYFANKKLATDPAWQKVQVILSGHNVSVQISPRVLYDLLRTRKGVEVWFTKMFSDQ